MRVKYKGPHRAVRLADGTRCERGKHTDVSDDLAEGLIERRDFVKAPQPKPPSPLDETSDAETSDHEE